LFLAQASPALHTFEREAGQARDSLLINVENIQSSACKPMKTKPNQHNFGVDLNQ
jgi:hypothetical protein